MSESKTMTITIDCHAYAWHEPDPNFPQDYPEAGPDNLPRMEREYGVRIRFLPDHPMNDWAWWYEITGTREALVRLLANEYGGEAEAREYVDAAAAEDLCVSCRLPIEGYASGGRHLCHDCDQQRRYEEASR